MNGVKEEAYKLKSTMLDEIRGIVDKETLSDRDKIELIKSVYANGFFTWKEYWNQNHR